MSAATKTAESPHRIIRDAAFAKRLEQACEGHPHVPPLHSGRLTWIKREMAARFKEDVAVETVRKWFAGEAKPRPDKLGKLAELLEADHAWLSLGLDATMTQRERKVRDATADGVVNLVAGLIQMDGGHPAFPKDGDPEAVDLHAIIRGAKYDLHVSLGEPGDDGKTVRFSVPSGHEDLVVLGVIRSEGFSVEIIEITPEMLEQGHRRGGSIVLTVAIDDATVRRIDSFKTRL